MVQYSQLFFFYYRAAQAAAALSSQTSGGSRKIPPPLLRSRTLPAIIVPGISILHTQLDPTRYSAGNFETLKDVFFFLGEGN